MRLVAASALLILYRARVGGVGHTSSASPIARRRVSIFLTKKA
jgi:hypothetical protein